MATTSESPPLKTDVLGRVRITAKHSEALLDAFEASSMTGVKLAAAHGIQNFSYIGMAGFYLPADRRAC